MKRLMIIVSVFAYLFYSCEEDDSNNIIFDTDYFPNTVGTYWVYESYDRLANKIDLITVSITGDTLFSGNTYKMWEYAYSDMTDTVFVIQTNDSVIFYNHLIGRITQLYIVPFETGNNWTNPDDNFDRSYVSDVHDLVINGINYHDAVLIERDGFGPNDYLIEKIWIKPNIGLVKLDRNHYILDPYKNESWILIEKSIH